MIILSLPIFTNGQGLILETSRRLRIPPSLVDHIHPLHSLGYPQFIILSDSIYLATLETGDLTYETLKTTPTIPPSQLNSNSVISFDEHVSLYYEGKLMFYDLKKQRISKKVSLSRKFRIVPWYTFQDRDHIYIVSYYNNNNRLGRGYDLVYLFKVSKRTKRVVLKRELDIGKEIILAPFNHQLVTFNKDKLYICSSISSKLLILDTKFNIVDSTYLDKTLMAENTQIFDRIFPDQNIPYYLFKPKDVIFHYTNSALNEVPAVYKILALNDSMLLVNYRMKPRELYRATLYNLRSKSVVKEDILPFSGHSFSSFCWTTMIYPNDNGEFVQFELESPDDSTLYYHAKVYSYNGNEPVSVEYFKNVNFKKGINGKENLSSFSGVILADDYFCKGCYSMFGTGEGVLVIKKQDFKNAAYFNMNHEYFLRNWNVTGDIWYVDDSTYKEIEKVMSKNVLYPLKHERFGNAIEVR